MTNRFQYLRLYSAVAAISLLSAAQTASAAGIPQLGNPNGPFTATANQVVSPAAALPSTATVAGTANGVKGGSPGTLNPCIFGRCAGPDTDAIDQSTQSMNQPPIDGNSGTSRDLFGGDTNNIAGLSADQLGALAPSAGGGLAATDSEAVDCLNAYLKSGYNTAELKDKCAGGNADTI